MKNMTTDFQNKELKQWHKASLRLTLPIIGAFLLVCSVCTLLFLGIPCAIASFISWVLVGDLHPDYTMVWCVFPWFVFQMYLNWLDDKDVTGSN